ncbi:MAG: ABC transporter permease [Gammaproteobacteria bacterium]
MSNDFYLAWRYLRFHRARTLIIIACLTLIAMVPVAMHFLLNEGSRQLTARAQATPLLIGARGSALDLTLNALFFAAASPSITMAEADKVSETGWADALPIYSRTRVRGHPLVGATLDYFDYRRLSATQGRMLAMLGECVLGAEAAESLNLKPGDRLPSTPENVFDLAGNYPLKLHVVGVLPRTGTPDDQAIFIDLQTAWVIDGIGHGHARQDKPAVSGGDLPDGVEAAERVVMDAKLLTYTEITEDDIDSFHFHGDPGSFPISAVIALPHDARAATLLRGRYVDDSAEVQIVRPLENLRGLLNNIFRVGALFDALLTLVGAATLLALGLIFTLSLRLRQKEIETITLIGCGRLTVARLVAAELCLLFLAAGGICLTLFECLRRYAGPIVHYILVI